MAYYYYRKYNFTSSTSTGDWSTPTSKTTRSSSFRIYKEATYDSVREIYTLGGESLYLKELTPSIISSGYQYDNIQSGTTSRWFREYQMYGRDKFQYRIIKIEITKGSLVNDEIIADSQEYPNGDTHSDGYYYERGSRIDAPIPEIISPRVGNELEQNTTVSIEWNATDLNSFDLIYDVQWRSESSTWTDIEVGTSMTNTTFKVPEVETLEFRIRSSNAYATSNWQSYSYVVVKGKFLFRDGSEVKKYVLPTPSESLIPVMTSNTEPYGEAFANSFDSFDEIYPWKAFNPNAGGLNRWGASGSSGWIAYDFGEGNEKVVAEYAMTMSSPPEMPKDWSFEGSNNKKDWEVLDTQSDIVWDFESRYQKFSFNNPTPYRYYRVNISSNNGSNLVSVGLIEMFIESSPSGWILVGTAPVTKEMFDEHGITDLSIIDNEAIQQLESDTPELLCWTDEENESTDTSVSIHVLEYMESTTNGAVYKTSLSFSDYPMKKIRQVKV